MSEGNSLAALASRLGASPAAAFLTMDAGQPTYVLAHWVRDRGLLSVGEAVRKLTSEGASPTGGCSRLARTPTSTSSTWRPCGCLRLS